MFENIIAQEAVSQLENDLRAGRLAPSMLFFGPPASGKGSAALELARTLSCGEGAAWNCSCPSCLRHRGLMHSDLLMLGPRPFYAEIAAARSAYMRDSATPAACTLFIRSVRKLLARFSPALLEDDPKAGKLAPLLQSLEEGLEEFERLAQAGGEAEKTSEALMKDALKLESEGLSDNIPIAHIRKASYWSRLAPNGKRKLLLIENADRMKEEGRNSLLKLLEEPPPTVSIVLTAQRREAVMATILSRLRPYRFLRRAAEDEREVIRRVFRDSEFAAPSGEGSGLVSAYLDTFLPQSTEKTGQLAAYFIASVARASALVLKKKGTAEIPASLSALGSRYAPLADYAGFARSPRAKDVVKTLLDATDNFAGRASSRFLKTTLEMVADAEREGAPGSGVVACNDIWRKYAGEADTAMNVLNQAPALALEALFFRLAEALADG